MRVHRVARLLLQVVLAWMLALQARPSVNAMHAPEHIRMMVSAYCDRGTMYDGVAVYPGAAAGGWDLPIRSKVSVPPFGVLTIHDRIGYVPWHHIDVWMASCAMALQWGVRYERVTVER